MAYTGRVPKVERLNKIRLQDQDMPICAKPHTDSATAESPITLNTAGQTPKAIMVDSPGACDLEIWGSIDNAKFKFLGRYEISEPSYFNLMEKISIPWASFQWLKFDRKAGVNPTITAYSSGLA